MAARSGPVWAGGSRKVAVVPPGRDAREGRFRGGWYPLHEGWGWVSLEEHEGALLGARTPPAGSHTRALPSRCSVARPAPCFATSEKLVDQLELGLLEAERGTQTPLQVIERAP